MICLEELKIWNKQCLIKFNQILEKRVNGELGDEVLDQTNIFKGLQRIYHMWQIHHLDKNALKMKQSSDFHISKKILTSYNKYHLPVQTQIHHLQSTTNAVVGSML